MDKNLILSNGDQKYEGEITWDGRGFQSAIDFILVNQSMYGKFINMIIDERKEKYDLSDHNLLTAYFDI